jgi:hypothetical protein
MDKGTCWLLTDSLGQTPISASNWRRWGRGFTHTVWPASISGYCTESVHLPYLLDPLYERYGPSAKLWLSEAGEPCHLDPVRVSANTWTTLVEWERPDWAGGPADLRVRLRFALLAAAASHPAPEVRGRLRGLPLNDLGRSAEIVERLCTEDRCHGRVPQSTCMAAMAIHSAASLKGGHPHPVDLAARHYPVCAWYAGMAAACAGADLVDLADAAVQREASPTARRFVAEAVVAS